MRFFNRSGPVNPEDHYCIPPLGRWNLEVILTLIRDKSYFVLHAPRQSGKTSGLLALRDLLNGGTVGDYRCVYLNVEGGQALREDLDSAMRSILDVLSEQAMGTLQDDFPDRVWGGMLQTVGPGRALGKLLAQWAAADPRPLVLLIDEIDTLIGDTLISVLRQLRASYADRPQGFPQSVVLCGVRDVRDYRIRSGSTNELVLGGSAFNVKAESLRLGDFTREDVFALLGQHTEETGQAFSDEALETVWARTQGQPWLVNALASRTCFPRGQFRDFGRTVEAEDIREAEELIIVKRETHLDQLADKLREDRVRRVVEPLLVGEESTPESPDRAEDDRDVEYARDLGLIARDSPRRIANPIYAEIIPRQLSFSAQDRMPQEPAWYVDADGALDMPKLLEGFQQFFRENSEHWLKRFDYEEAAPQLLLQAFLQRIINGGGRIEREYGLGRRRTDLLIVWPQGDKVRKHVIECKLLHKGLEQTMAEGLEQTAGYMDRCGAESGHLVVFDRDEGKKWEEKIFRRSGAFEDAKIEVWGM